MDMARGPAGESGMNNKVKRKPMGLEAIVGETAAISIPEAVKTKEARPGQRTHVKQLTLYLPHSVYRQLRELAFHEEKRMHSLLMEGLDRVFADRGARSIEQLTRDS